MILLGDCRAILPTLDAESVAALAEGFCFVGIELDPEYAEIARRRTGNVAPLFAEPGAAALAEKAK